MKLSRYLLLLFLALISCSDDDDDPVSQNMYTDNRDGEVYEIVTIGDQVWFAENLRFDTMDIMSDCYDFNDTNCFIYGRYYTGDGAINSCPDGWHVPSVEEWQELFDYFGGSIAAAQFLEPYATLQGEEVGFNLLAGGWSFNSWELKDIQGRYYTSTDGGLANSLKYMAYNPGVAVALTGTVSKGVKLNCRCVKD